MKKLLLNSTVGAVVLALPTASSALDYVFGGAYFESEYVSQGLELSDGASVGAYIEAGLGGFYFGIYGQTADDNFAGYGREYGPYLGYRGSLGDLSYDAVVYHYEFDNNVESYQEYILDVSYAATPALSVGVNYAYAPDLDGFDTDQHEIGISASYATGFNDVTLTADYANVDFRNPFGDFEYDFWSVGLSAPLGDNVTIDLKYHGTEESFLVANGVTNAADGLITLAVSADFSLR